MEKLKEKLKPNNIIVIVFIIILLIEHMGIPNEFSGDDWYFVCAIEEYGNIWNFMKLRYNEWSSRIIIEVCIVSLLNMWNIVWKILNIVMWTLLAKSISKICMNEKPIINIVIYFLVWIIPRGVINNVGWIATSLNYLWVCSLGCYTISVIVDYIKKEKISLWKLITYVLACIYASNLEIMVVLIFLSLTVYLLYEVIKNKSFEILKTRKFILFLILITVFSLIFILTCPGNYVRKADEIKNWFPNFGDFNLANKLEISLTSTMSEIFLELNTYYIILSIVCFGGIVLLRKSIVKKIFSILPFVLCIIINIFSNINKYPYILISVVKTKFQILDLVSKTVVLTWLDWIMYIIMLLCIILLPVCMYYIFEDKKKSWSCIFIYMLGMFSRVIMGFSPTVFASGERTFIFLYVSFIICSMMILKEILNKCMILKHKRLLKKVN